MMKKLLGIFLIIFMATSVFAEESEFEKTKRINEEKVKALRAHWKAARRRRGTI